MAERLNSSNADRIESGQGEHSARALLPVPHRSKFEKILCEFLGYSYSPLGGAHDGRHAAMRDALDNRATIHQIREWRRGRTPAPKWAMDLLTAKIAAHVHHHAHLLDEAKLHKPGPGHAWNKRIKP